MDMASNTYPQHLAGLVKDGTLKLDDIDFVDGLWPHIPKVAALGRGL